MLSNDPLEGIFAFYCLNCYSYVQDTKCKCGTIFCHLGFVLEEFCEIIKTEEEMIMRKVLE